MDEKVIMMFDGEMVDYMIAVNPEYKKFVHTTKTGKGFYMYSCSKHFMDACKARYYGSSYSPRL